MKKFLLILSVLLIILTSCKKEEISTNDIINNNIPADTTPVDTTSTVEENDSIKTISISFGTYYNVEEMKSYSAVGSVCTRLDVYLVDNTVNPNQIRRFHKTLPGNNTGNNDYGTINVSVNSTHTYTIYAVAHKGMDTAILNGNVISFPNGKTTHTFFYREVFTPALNTTMTCAMKRIVGMFKLNVMDNIPDSVVCFRFIVDSAYNRWSLNDHAENLAHLFSVITINNYNNNGGATFNLYCMSYDDTTTIHPTITVEALTNNNEVFDTRTFYNVPIRNNYITTYEGNFFTGFTMPSGFVIGGWQGNDTIYF